MPTRRLFRFVLIVGVAAHFAGGLIKMAARRHLAEDAAGSVGAKVGGALAP